MFVQALEIFKGAFGEEHNLVAREIDALAMLYQKQGKHELAEPMHRRALSIRRKNKSTRSTKVCQSYLKNSLKGFKHCSILSEMKF